MHTPKMDSEVTGPPWSPFRVATENSSSLSVFNVIHLTGHEDAVAKPSFLGLPGEQALT